MWGRLFGLIASTTACSLLPARGTMFDQLVATAEPHTLHGNLVQHAPPEDGSMYGWRMYTDGYTTQVVRSAPVTVNLVSGSLALGHLADGGAKDKDGEATAQASHSALVRTARLGHWARHAHSAARPGPGLTSTPVGALINPRHASRSLQPSYRPPCVNFRSPASSYAGPLPATRSFGTRPQA